MVFDSQGYYLIRDSEQIIFIDKHILNRGYPPGGKCFFTFLTLRVRNKLFKSLNLGLYQISAK